MEVISVFPQHTKLSPELTSHIFPRTSIVCDRRNEIPCCPQNIPRKSSAAITSPVVPRIEIARVRHNCRPYVSPVTAIACFPQNCHGMWSQELTTFFGPAHWHPIMVHTNGIACGFQKCHGICSPQLPSTCVPHNCHPYVVPRNDLNQIQVTTITVDEANGPSVALSADSYRLF